MPNTEIDGERLWSSLMELARIGATPKGGVRRITLTPTCSRAVQAPMPLPHPS